MTDNLSRYLELLRLQPGATKDEISTAYYAVLEQFPENPTEEQEARLQEVKHAFSILQRNYRPVAPRRSIARGARSLMPALALAALVLGGVFAALNYQSIRMALVEYRAGDVLRFKDKREPYGRVLRFDPVHRFHVGEPSPAYEIRLSDGSGTVWVSDRIAIKAMVPMKAGEPQAAGVGGR
jgi:hypothetical protein